MTWLQLYNKIGKQPLYLLKNKTVQIKINNELKDCKIVYDSGTSFHLEVVNNNE